MNSWLLSDKTRRKYSISWLLALTLAGLAGNYFYFPIFFNIDFLFGSIFAMLALQFFGLGWGTLAAALIASYTWVLWNEPYALVIMTVEVAVVGALMQRYKIGLVLADTIYWLIIGLPLAYLSYAMVLQLPLSSSTIIMTKQAVNGIANALLANLVVIGFALGSRSRPISFREIIYNLLASFALIPALILLAISSRSDFADTDQTIRSSFEAKSQAVTRRLTNWVQDKTRMMLTLADLAATLSAQQMQGRLEQARDSDRDFLRIGLRDSESIITAYVPPSDETGLSNIGKKFPERPYISELRKTLKPMLAELVMGRIDRPEPIVVILAPVLRQGVYAGYVNSVLRLDQIRMHLEYYAEGDALLYTLIDSKGQVILSNRHDQKIMTPFARGIGTLHPVNAKISQWRPVLPPNTSISEQWKQSYYVAQYPVDDARSWQLILEQPVAPFQKVLYNNYSAKLLELFLLLICALLLAEWLSRRAMGTVDILNVLTRDLPRRLSRNDQEIEWPQTAITETNLLIGNFREMSDLLTVQFDDVQEANEMLEQRVQERTVALQASEEAYRTVADFTNEWEYWLRPDGTLRYMSPSCERHTGYLAQEFLQDPVLLEAIVLAEDQEKLSDHSSARQGAPQTSSRHQIDFRIITRGGELRWFAHVCQPVYDAAGKYLGQRASNSDITERRQMQEQLRQLAFYDALTQLPNRRLLSDRLSQAMATSKRSDCFCALMMLDLDNFKSLNDTHGHLAGDLLLIEVASRLTSGVREIDTVARTGGDEFVVLLGELNSDQAASTSQAAMIAEKIRLSLVTTYQLVVRHEAQPDILVEHHCSASIGVVLFAGNETRQDDIFKWADAAMYQAKAAGRNQVCFYERDQALPSPL
jgi:diguanylate cyclase (GGDEF)-like protein/PAS domain S-box-containing protein